MKNISTNIIILTLVNIYFSYETFENHQEKASYVLSDQTPCDQNLW